MPTIGPQIKESETVKVTIEHEVAGALVKRGHCTVRAWVENMLAVQARMRSSKQANRWGKRQKAPESPTIPGGVFGFFWVGLLPPNP